VAKPSQVSNKIVDIIPPVWCQCNLCATIIGMAKKIPLTIRLTEQLHQEVVRLTGEENVSINVLLAGAFELYVQYRDAEKKFRAAWLGGLLGMPAQVGEPEVEEEPERTVINEDRFYGGGDG